LIDQWKTAWITGATHGIGRAMAEQLAAAGVRVAVSSRSQDDLASMQEKQQQIVPVRLDVSDEFATSAAVNEIVGQMELPDLVILNAGIYEPNAAASVTAEAYRKHIEVNYIGVTNCVAAILPRMLERGYGQIAIVASVAGYRGLPQSAAYGPTKAALINLAETLRLELQGSGVDIRMVNPGFVATRLTDKNEFTMPAVMSPDMAAAKIIRGLQGRRFEIVFPWRFIIWLKLLRVLPWRVYSVVVRRFTGL
jgi:short-subunit dehydrogenase